MSELEPQNCPHCAERGLPPDTTRNLNINTEKGEHCFRCEWAAPYGTTTQGELIDPGLVPYQTGEKLRLDKIDLFSFDIKTVESKEIFEYVIKRLGKFHEYVPIRWSPQLPDRVVFPVYEHTQLACLNARAVDETMEPRYISYGPKGHYLWPPRSSDSHVVLTEGPFDALSVSRGICGFGAGLTETQMKLLCQYPLVFIAFDGDEAGLNNAERVKEFLCSQPDGISPQVIVMKLPKGKDPNSLGYEYMTKWTTRILTAVI